MCLIKEKEKQKDMKRGRQVDSGKRNPNFICMIENKDGNLTHEVFKGKSWADLESCYSSAVTGYHALVCRMGNNYFCGYRSSTKDVRVDKMFCLDDSICFYLDNEGKVTHEKQDVNTSLSGNKIWIQKKQDMIVVEVQNHLFEY